VQLWWTSVIIIIVERRNPVRREDLARLSRGGLSVISGRRRAIRRCGKTKSCNGEGEVYFAMSRERVVGCRTLASGKEFGTNRQNGCDVGGSSNRRKGFRLRGAAFPETVWTASAPSQTVRIRPLRHRLGSGSIGRFPHRRQEIRFPATKRTAGARDDCAGWLKSALPTDTTGSKP